MPTPAATTAARLLVLPFKTMSGGTGDEYLAEGFTEELIAEAG